MTIKEIFDNIYIVNENTKQWQDWMLEDEPVKDIKKRVLIKEVAQAVVRCTKYILKNENESANLQKKLFEIGCKWLSGCEEVQNEECKYLFVSVNLKITTSSSEEIFIKDKFTEVKVKQLNKNDMETKEMTRKEVADFLRHTKVLCTSTEETAKVQEKLFELGFEWNTKGKIINENAFLLYIDEPNIFYTEMIKWWIENDKKRINPNEILAIQLKEEKPKFDPKTLRPFDKVLVRNSNTDIWRARFFDLYVNGLYETASGEKWEFCIPYNEDTKHLHYNANMAPEFYRDCEDF